MKTINIKKYEIEKNAKNRAYAFILAAGLFNEFQLFVEETQGIEPMKICHTILAQ